MKLYLVGIVFLINSHILQAQVKPPSSPEVIREFHWGGADLEPFENKWPWTGGQGGTPQDPSIAVEWHDKGPVSQTLRTLGSDIVSHVTSAHYAIVGKLKYTNVSAGSYLEMLSYFAPDKEGGPEQMYFSRTLGDSGPMAKLEGTDEGRDFLLPFDATGAKTKLVRLVLNLHLTGPGGVELSDVKLVQYPEGTLQTAERPSSPLEPSAVPQTQIVADLPVEKYLSSEQDQKDLLAHASTHEASEDQAQVSVVKEADGTSELLLTRSGSTGLCRTALLTVPQDVVRQITGTRYGIMGEVSYSLAAKGALGMESVYSQVGLNAPIDRWYQASYGPNWGAHSESMGLMEDNRDWGKFYLGFDRRWADRRPNADLIFKRIVFDVLLDGSGTVHLRNLKLVQYPEPPPEPKAQTPVATPGSTFVTTPAGGLDWKSFFLGVAALGTSLLAGRGIAFISRRWNHRRHERELRRIASLDS